MTLVISNQDVAISPLMLTGPLKRLVAHHCTCMAGAGTNRACAHILAVCIGVFSPECFHSVKKNLGRLTDINLPAEHQADCTGN